MSCQQSAVSVRPGSPIPDAQLRISDPVFTQHNGPVSKRCSTGQLRRACASIPANIAEGCGRSRKADFARFLHIAMGSASELEYFLLLVKDLRFLTDGQYEPLAGQVGGTKRMLTA